MLGTPVSISVDKINIKASIENVGLDSFNRMNVPKNYLNVGYYKPGYKIGQKGNAAIDGHFDTPTGAPGVFYNLAKLAPGDEIKVFDNNNQVAVFSVTEVQSCPYRTFPIEKVFGKSNVSMLNLITCAVEWDINNKIYQCTA